MGRLRWLHRAQDRASLKGQSAIRDRAITRAITRAISWPEMTGCSVADTRAITRPEVTGYRTPGGPSLFRLWYGNGERLPPVSPAHEQTTAIRPGYKPLGSRIPRADT